MVRLISLWSRLKHLIESLLLSSSSLAGVYYYYFLYEPCVHLPHFLFVKQEIKSQSFFHASGLCSLFLLENLYCIYRRTTR